MQNWLGLNAEQVATVGTGIGLFLAAVMAAFRGYKADHRKHVVDIPKAAIPDDLKDEIDRIEKKVDNLAAQSSLIYTDTQVIRALTPKP